MKRHVSYAVGALGTLTVLLSGCSKQAVERSVEGERKPVQFCYASLGNEERAINNGADTKVTNDHFDVGDKIGIYAYPSSLISGAMFGEGEDTRKNVQYVALGGENGRLAVAQSQGEEPIYFPTDVAKTLDFKGYYPYSKDMTADGVLAVNLANQRGGQEWAILYSNNATKQATTANFIKLEFRYAVAQVVINLQYDEAMQGESISNVRSVVLAGTGLYTEGDFQVETGTVTAKMNGSSGGGSAGGEGRGQIVLQPGVATTQATVLPGTGAVKDLTITVEDAGYTYVARPKDVTSGYQAGRQYIYHVTLKGGGEAEIGETTILPWEPGNDAGIEPPIIGEPEN